MTAFSKSFLIWTALAASAALALVYLWLVMIGLAWTPYTCITEVRGRTTDVSGFDFEVSETNCDTFAKTVTISVFASRPGRPRKVLLFKFFPAFNDKLPVVSAVDQHTVRISIPEISSLAFRREKLGDLSVNYSIGITDYPDKEPKNTE